MLVALLLVASLTEWVPARWQSADPASLALLQETPINCILIEREHWSPELAAKATGEEIATLGVVRPGAAAAVVAEAKTAGLTGVALEGPFPNDETATLRAAAERAGLTVVELRERTSMTLGGSDPIVGTYQGVWPGIHVGDDGAAKAAPTGAPWIETNSGFVRFVRSRTSATVWLGNLPPGGEIVKLSRYLQTVGDAAMVGARWIVALDGDFNKRLLGGEQDALADWKKIGETLRFWEEHRQQTLHPPAGRLALVQDVDSGGLLSNGILDMLCARHTPLRTVPPPALKPAALDGAKMVLNIDPKALTAAQQEVLMGFTRGGGTMLSAPGNWDIHQEPGQVSVAEDDVETLDHIWRGVNMTIGRDNLGVRLFNVASMRSELAAVPDGSEALHLVNYSDYPVENVTVRPLKKYTRATLCRPSDKPVELEIFENGEIDIEVIDTSAILILESPSGLATDDDDHHHH